MTYLDYDANFSSEIPGIAGEGQPGLGREFFTLARRAHTIVGTPQGERIWARLVGCAPHGRSVSFKVSSAQLGKLRSGVLVRAGSRVSV